MDDINSALLRDYLIYKGVLSSKRSGGKYPAQDPSVFTLGNGFIGVRGVLEESGHLRGERPYDVVYLNGIYENVPIDYHEGAHGYPDHSQVRIPVIDCNSICFQIDGEIVPNQNWKQIDHTRQLDINAALLSREIRFENEAGNSVVIKIERFVSAAEHDLVAARVRVTGSGFTGVVRVVNRLHKPFANPTNEAESETDEIYDPRKTPDFMDNPWSIIREDNGPNHIHVLAETQMSKIQYSVYHALVIDGEGKIIADDLGELVKRVDMVVQPNEEVSLTFYTVYSASLSTQSDMLHQSSKARNERHQQKGFDSLRDEHSERIAKFMACSEVNLHDRPELNGALAFNRLQLYMSVGKNSQTSIGAKGLTGEGYEGHVFWDAEVFVLPFFAYSEPDIARSMLLYRFGMLSAARENTATMGHKTGALYPWRTITGVECSSFFPAGAAQYHINADIAYAIKLYVETTNDLEFLLAHGLEMLIELARIWPQVGFFNPNKSGKFCINQVTGPDEYSALVDNNLYTNSMAKSHLSYTLKCISRLKSEQPDVISNLFSRLNVDYQELSQWQKIVENMYLPFDVEKKLYLQDEHFMDKELWDFEGTPAENFPLLLHYHPLVIYRKQVSKQADAVLTMVQLPDEFSLMEKQNVLDYYEGITTHDSTLSPGTFSILAIECNDEDRAVKYLETTTVLDLDNLFNNSDHGLHMAAMANSWATVTYGLGGMKQSDEGLSFNPSYFASIGSYDFVITYRNCRIKVSVDRRGVVYSLVKGDALVFQHGNTRISLKFESQKSVLVSCDFPGIDKAASL